MDYDSGLGILSPNKYSRYYYGRNDDSNEIGFVEKVLHLVRDLVENFKLEVSQEILSGQDLIVVRLIRD